MASEIADPDPGSGQTLDEVPPGSLLARLAARYGGDVVPEASLREKDDAGFASSVAARLLEPGAAAGRYEIRGEIARGGWVRSSPSGTRTCAATWR